MRIAYLIQCHKNKEHIEKLLNRLDNENVLFFVHIDKKANLILNKRDNLILVKDIDRIDVQWGDISIIEATIVLMRYLIESGLEFDYCALISGQDYPIKSNYEIMEFFNKNNGYDFVDFSTDNDINSVLYKRFNKRMEIKYPLWILQNKFIIKVLKKLYIYATGGYSHTLIGKRKLKSYKHFYFGSAWWALQKSTLELVYRELCRKNWIMDDLVGSECSDECFMQTILLNNAYGAKIKSNITFVDFTNRSRSPWDLDDKWFDTLRVSDKLFARKFETGVSNVLIEKIDKELLS